MGTDTAIEWTRGDDGRPGLTWNPTTGCDRISPGCDHCYALTMAKRLKAMGSAKYQNDGDPRTSGPGFALTPHPSTLDWPVRRTEPRRIFVNSMSDLFHQDVPVEFIADVWATMAVARWHTFQILTKRADRMRRVLLDPGFRDLVSEATMRRWGEATTTTRKRAVSPRTEWPLGNVWLGTSIESQQYAFRARHLLVTPAAVRFISAEPLLGPLDLSPYLGLGPVVARSSNATDTLDWVIVGGESGPGARPMHPDWARALRDQCQAEGVAFFFKQWGNWVPVEAGDGRAGDTIVVGGDRLGMAGQTAVLVGPPSHYTLANAHGAIVRNVGKHETGRELDGRTHSEFPTERSVT